jgi:uncharacterized protein (TIGR02453 family)
MISKSIIEFLNLLKLNNTREWFHANKELYDQAKKDFEVYTSELIKEISLFDKSVEYLEPKDCIFRIFRDIRFSKDKTPYKVNFGAYIVKGGKKGGNAGYYIHIQPGESFLAGGIYMPPPEILKTLRNGIYENIDEFLKIISSKSFIKYFDKVDGEKTKNVPPGFPKEFEHADFLKFKSYNVIHYINDELLVKNSFDKYALGVFREMLDFNNFINNCIEEI